MKRRYKPKPDDGLVNLHHMLMTPEQVQRYCKHIMDEWDTFHRPTCILTGTLLDPDYYLADKIRAKKLKKLKNGV